MEAVDSKEKTPEDWAAELQNIIHQKTKGK